jgi:hypothetical protein
MSLGEREQELFNEWRYERNIESWEEGIMFSLWQINKSLEKLVKATKEKQ